jgi:hypothetical protein
VYRLVGGSNFEGATVAFDQPDPAAAKLNGRRLGEGGAEILGAAEVAQDRLFETTRLLSDGLAMPA